MRIDPLDDVLQKALLNIGRTNLLLDILSPKERNKLFLRALVRFGKGKVVFELHSYKVVCLSLTTSFGGRFSLPVTTPACTSGSGPQISVSTVREETAQAPLSEYPLYFSLQLASHSGGMFCKSEIVGRSVVIK